MRRFMTIVAAGVLPYAFGSANAAITIDQSQPVNTEAIAIFLQGDLAQSFQQANNNVAGAGIFLGDGHGQGGDVTIALWDKLPNEGGVQLAGDIAAGTPGNWVDVYWSPVSVTPDTTLFLVFTSTDAAMAIAGDMDNPYPRGQVYANPGYQDFSELDYAFRTYYETALASIPAPGALLLAGVGISLISYVRRRAGR